MQRFFEAGILEASWAERIGWTLLHSLWQIAVIAGLYAMVAALLRGRSAQARYLAGCVALLAMVCVPVGTWLLLPGGSGAGELTPTPVMEESVVSAPGALPLPDVPVPPVEGAADPLPVLPAPELASAPDAVPAEAPLATFSSAALRPWMPWATAVWLLGVCLLSLRPVMGWLHIRRLQRHGLTPLSSSMRRDAASLARRLGVTRAVRFVQSVLVEVPTVVGFLRPCILLPASAVTGLSVGQVEMILAHELAHIRRHDYLVNLVQTLLEALLFFHPAMWWVSRQVRKERENCCDDIAVAVTGNRKHYVQALTRLEEQRAATSVAVLAATGGSLLERGRRLLGQPCAGFGYRSATAWLAGMLAIGMVSLALTTGGASQGEDARETTPAEKIESEDSGQDDVHPAEQAVRELFKAIEDEDYDRATALCASGEIRREGLDEMRRSFDWSRMEIAEGLVGGLHGMVLTKPFPASATSRAGQFGFSLIAHGDRWLIRDADFLPDDAAVEKWRAEFREVEPLARPAEAVEQSPQSDREFVLAYAKALAAGDFETLEQTWEFSDDLDRQFAREIAAMFARAEEMNVEIVSLQPIREDELFVCFLSRNGPDRFGKEPAPHYTIFHRKDGRWRCAAPQNLRTMLQVRSLGVEQLGRRNIALQAITMRFIPDSLANRIARMRAQRDAFARLTRPPYNLDGFEVIAEQMTASIKKMEAMDADTGKDLWRRMLEKHGEDALPQPGDFYLRFHLAAGKDDSHVSEIPFADMDETFKAEPFPCLTDDHVLRAGVSKGPYGKTSQVDITLTRGGAKLFAELTRQSVNKRLAIVIEDKVVVAPVIMTELGKQVVVTGNFSREEAEAIAKKLNAYREQAAELIQGIGGEYSEREGRETPKTESALFSPPVSVEEVWIYPDGGTTAALFVDAAGKRHAVCFDNRIDTSTPGKLFIGEHPGDKGARAATRDEDEQVVAALRHWLDSKYPAKRQKELLAKGSVSGLPDHEMQALQLLWALKGRRNLDIGEPKVFENPDNPLGLDNPTLIELFHTGKTLRAAARECVAYQVKYGKNPERAEDLFEDYQQFAKDMIVDPFAAEGGVLRITERNDGPGDHWLQVWSVGPDGDWDGGKPIDSSDPSLDGDLGAEMRVGKWKFHWLADETMTMHLDGKRLSHYLAAQGPRHPGPINPRQTLKWGPVVDGLRMAVKLVPEKESYTLGERIGLEFHVRNVSPVPITIAGFSWRQDAGPDCFVIRNGQGDQLKVGHGWYSGATPIQRDTLKAGRVAVFKSSALAFLAEGMPEPGHPVGHTVITGPGRHTLQFKLIFPDGGSSVPDGMPRPTDWQGTLETGTVELSVGAADHAPNASADIKKAAMLPPAPVRAGARERFVVVEQLARLPREAQAKLLPTFYQELVIKVVSPGVEMILSSYPHHILDRFQEGDAFDGNTDRWARQLAEAAATMSVEQVAGKLEDPLWLNVAARARALQVLKAHRKAVTALVAADLKTRHREAFDRAAAVIIPLELRAFIPQILELYLANDQLSEPARKVLIWLHDAGVVATLLKEVNRDPESLRRHASLFLGPLAGNEAPPLLKKLLESPDVEIRYHAAYALQECRDPELAPWAVRLAKEKEARFRFLAAHYASKLPEESFAAVRAGLLPLLDDADPKVRCYALLSFGGRKDLAAGPVILELLKGDEPAEQHKVWTMQAMSALSGKHWHYDMHNWGPDQPGNRKAIEKFEAWLKEQGVLVAWGDAAEGVPVRAGDTPLLIEEARTGHKTPEDLAESVFECLRKKDWTALMGRTVVNEKERLAVEELRLRAALDPGDTSDAKIMEQARARTRNFADEILEDWRGFVERGERDFGIDWTQVKIERIACEIAGSEIMLGCEPRVVFSAGGDHFEMYLDDCILTDRGWLAGDGPVWKGRVDPPAEETKEGEAARRPEGEEFLVEIKSLEDIRKNTTLSKGELQSWLEMGKRYEQNTRAEHPGGDVYAYGCILKEKPLHVVFVPVNGGRIEPRESGRTKAVSFYNPTGQLLGQGISRDGKWRCQMQEHAGSGSNHPRSKERVKQFYYVLGTEPAPWGEAVDGVMMCITKSKFRIPPGGELDLRVEIYNGGEVDRRIALEHEAWELEIDGKWLKVTGGVEGRRRHLPLPAKQAQHQVEVWPWLWENMTAAIKELSPGKHTIRVARLLNGDSRSPKNPPQIRVISQPVTVEVIATQSSEGASAKKTNTFAIYQVLGHKSALPFGKNRDSVRRRILFSEEGEDRFDAMRPDNYPLGGLILAGEPLITQDDLSSYDWKRHVMMLKPDARGKLPKPSVWGVPFVVAVNGKPLFLGAFWSGASSYSAHMPTISLDLWNTRLPDTDPSHLPQNAIRISSGPVANEGDLPNDPRRNPQLYKALQKTGKLVDIRSMEEPWGKEVSGIKARLRTERLPRWSADDPTPWVLFDLKNNSKDLELILTSGSMPPGVIIDGKLYQRVESINGRAPICAPGQSVVGAKLILDKKWTAQSTANGLQVLHLKPGKHTVQAVVSALQQGEHAGQPVRVLSNPIEIEILEEAGSADKEQHTGEVSINLPKQILPILQALKGEVGTLAGEYPQLAGAKTVEVKPDEWLFGHDCRFMGKRGYEHTGPFPVAIGLKVMTTGMFDELSDKAAMTPPGYRWDYLGLVGWPTLHVSDEIPPVLVGKLQEALGNAVRKIGPLNRQALDDGLPEAIRTERDRLLAEADRKIRNGVMDLAGTHPLLRKGQSWDRLGRPSGPGRIGIHLRRTHTGKGRTDAEAFPPSEAFSILVVLKLPPDEIEQLVLSSRYPHLGLVGQVGTRAADPALDAALKKLVADALAPLAELEHRAAGRHEPPESLMPTPRELKKIAAGG